MGSLTWDWNALRGFGGDLLGGAVVTVLLAAFALAAGLLAGAALGLLLSGRGRVRSIGAAVLLTPFRIIGGLPAAVLLLGVHEALPGAASWLHAILARLGAAAQPHVGSMEEAVLAEVTRAPFASALLALGIVLAARVADAVRRGTQCVSPHHLDVARALGLSPAAQMQRVVLPGAFRASALELGSACLDTIRYTALAFIIGCQDLLGTAMSIAREHGHHLELLTTVAVAYIAVLGPAHLFGRRMVASRWRQRCERLS